MRCTSYCTASYYDIPRLFQDLQTKGPCHLYRDIIHTQLKEEKKIKGDTFYFSFGVVVIWGFIEEEEKEILDFLKDYEKEPLGKVELDEFSYVYSEAMKIEEDEISLQNKSILTKLAISHGIAQSVKLTVFEELIQKTIDHTKRLPRDLARKGKISLSRKEISKKMGELFIERNFINLHTEILDTPEFFWDHPELESFYRRTVHYLDVNKRVEVLNKRLNVVHELFEILSNELNHQHSSRLEMTIIGLIVIEVVIALLRDLFHLI
ncbi:MAG: RMD1 family protein [Anaerolineae bacterium]